MERVRLGVVGCGVMGKRHLAAAAESPLLEPVAVADRFEEKAGEAAREYGIEKVYAEGAMLIEDPDVDAVVLATPTADRNALGVPALEKGKHLLVEKPVAMTAADVERMIAARGDRVAACCSGRYHFLASTTAAREVVAAGALGELRVVHCRAHGAAGPPRQKSPPAWRLNKALNGGGILVNWGCYDLDYLFDVAGWTLKPRTVLAQAWTVPPRLQANVAEGSDAETHFSALIRCDGGTVITFERGEYMPAHSESAWQIVGTQGALNLVMVPQEGKVITHDDLTAEEGVVTRTVWEGTETWGDMLGRMVVDFAEAIVHGREPATTLEKSLVIQKITDAIYASAESGRAVDIS